VLRVSGLIGAHQTVSPDSVQVHSSVDELYRLALLFHQTGAVPDSLKAWTSDSYKGTKRLAAYATADGKRAAFVLLPERQATVIILTNDANADARAMAEKIIDQILTPR
jgi:hypothetical protein